MMRSCGCGGVGIPVIWFLFLISFTATAHKEVWAKPGCHVVVFYYKGQYEEDESLFNKCPYTPSVNDSDRLALGDGKTFYGGDRHPDSTGHIRKIRIPNCVEFQIATNACRGYCKSWAVPSALDALSVNPNQPITSVAECCNMMETEDISANVLCLGNVVKELTFKSAKSCSCFHCKKD